MSRFVAWNELLLTEFFSPEFKDEDVWLRATRDELDSFGLHLGGARDLVDAVASGAPWLPGGLPTCADAARILVQQRQEPFHSSSYRDPGALNPSYAGARAPAYLPILALWVLAASGKQEEGGFYAEVGELLGRPFPRTKVAEAMLTTWKDLETWSTEECAGRFGRFQCRVLGEHRFVGIPRSQCLISRHDERNLSRLFWEFRLRPGQNLPNATLERMLERGREAHFLTRALRSAMGRQEYAVPLAILLRKLLESWDGTRPRTAEFDANGRERGPSGGEVRERPAGLTLALSPSEDVVNGWDVGWTFPAALDVPRCTLEFGGRHVPAFLDRARACFRTDASEPSVHACAIALSESAVSRLEVDVRAEDEADGTWGDQTRREVIEQASRRILAWNSPDARFGQQLVERDIPLYGTFYVLCSPVDRSRTESWLQREGVAFEPVLPLGLPTDWWMACIDRAELLTAEQRQHLAEAPELVEVPAGRIRLVGGRTLLRGGARLFAAYDLPAIEIEGPPGSVLQAAGLRVSEVQDPLRGSEQSGPRRFLIDALEAGHGGFELKLVSNGLVLCRTRLRIADPEGEGRGEMRDFSLDLLGFPKLDVLGLRGARIGANAGLLEIGWKEEEMLGVGQPPLDGSQSVVAGNPAAAFLDTLASLGSMSYGAARDQLSRLSGDGNPISLLMDLRARGCLEIQTDGKGHLVRIHSTVPTLFGLPARQDGLPLFGVSGTLRLAHWSTLQNDQDFLASVGASPPGHLPALRLSATDADAVRGACRNMGFEFDSSPAKAVASWAGSVRDARDVAASIGSEFLSAELAHLHRLMPDSARFVAVGDGRLTIDRESGAQLFRFDDPQAPALQLYVLGVRRADGSSRYSHVQDSRWGVWISQLAFAEMLKNRYGRDDAFPWPVHYDPASRDLWLPARLRPPAVLERALSLCSGTGPAVHFLADAGRLGDRLLLVDQGSGTMVGSCSLVYEKFLPGRWLRYSWVPVDLACKIVGLLGCALESFTSAVKVGGLEALEI